MDLRHKNGVARIVDVFLCITKTSREGEWLHAVFIYRLRIERPLFAESIITERSLVGCKQIAVVGICVCSRGIGEDGLVLSDIGLEIQVEQRTDGLLTVINDFCRISPVRVCDIGLLVVSRIIVY